MRNLLFFVISFLALSCESQAPKSDSNNSDFADVTAISVTGAENSYTFNITISSPDKGCDQYADWWEVVSTSGELIYRRILLHSHVNEQPFTRSGGAVTISENQTVWVRAHMNNNGYGGATMKGTVKDGFNPANFPDSLGINLDQVEPLPDGCNF